MTAWVLESALRSLMMAMVVWAGIKTLRVRSVVAQKTAWILVLVAAIAMPLVMRWQLWQPKAAVVVPIRHFVDEATSPRVANNITLLPAMASLPAVQKQPVMQWRDFVAPAYLLIAGILLLRIAIGLLLSARLWRRAESASVLVEPRASVRISSDVETPVTIGSTILLPASYEGWDRRKLRVVLAHERSHVRQADFYLQLAAGLYTAIFWFSPLGWWLKKELSDLGEAISDRAALRESEEADRTHYAELLVEFAAMPRRTMAGVAMARVSNIRRRVDRLLTEQKFRSAFTTCRWHLASAAVLVPAALVAAVTLVRVQTADAMKLPVFPLNMPSMAAVPVSASIPVRVLGHAANFLSRAQEQSTTGDSGHSTSYAYIGSDVQDSYAVVSGDSTNIKSSWDSRNTVDQVRKKIHGDFIWFARDGKSYVIEDSALVKQAKDYFRPVEELGRRQGELGEQQGRLGEEQGRLGQQQATVSTQMPDVSKEMASLEATLQRLKQQSEIKQEDIAAFQGKLADLQGRLGDLQGRLGSKQAEFGAQQAKLGEQQAKLGAQQAELGRQQAALSREADQKMKALIDGALQQGKAKPVE